MRRPNRAIFEPLESRTLLAGSPLGVSEASYLGGVQLRLQGTAGADAITVTRAADGGGLLVESADGWSRLFDGSYKSLRIDAAAGNDSVTLDASVDLDAILYGGAGNDALTGGSGDDRLYGGLGANTLAGGAGDDVLVSLGGAANDRLTGNTGRDSFWLDAAKAELVTDASAEELATGSVHRVGSYFAGTNKPEAGGTTTRVAAKAKTLKAPKAHKAPKLPKQAKPAPVSPMDLLGQDLADPATTAELAPGVTYQRFDDRPLFAEGGPSADDVVQGFVGDCYFLAVLSSVAKIDPTEIRETVVDLGDGTYCVQFTKGGKSVFLRVDNELPKFEDFKQLPYAGLGAQDSMWVAVVEKAYAFFRTGAGTYRSIESGWMGEAYAALGFNSTSTYKSTGAAALLAALQKDLLAGKSVTFAVGTPAAGSNLLGFHAYGVDAVVTNANGTPTHVRLRNPWGTMDGDTTLDGDHDGYVTVTAQQAFASFLGFTSAIV